MHMENISCVRLQAFQTWAGEQLEGFGFFSLSFIVTNIVDSSCLDDEIYA